MPGEFKHRSIVKITPLRGVAASAGVLALVGGTLGFAALNTSVTLSVDGKASDVTAFAAGNVGEILDEAGVEVGEHDIVVPSVDASVSDGDTVSVRYGRQLTVTTDGVDQEYWTTATTVDAALSDLGIRTEAGSLSVSRSQAIGRQGLKVTVNPVHDVTLTVDGVTTEYVTRARTVSDLLDKAKVSLGALDRMNTERPNLLTDGSGIVINRVEVRSATHTEAIAFETTTEQDSSLYTDQSRVITPGVEGSRTVTGEETVVDGVVESFAEQSSTVDREPTTQVVAKTCGTGSPCVSPVATGASIPATATTAACSSTTGPGSVPAAATSPSAPTSRLVSSRSRWPTGSTPRVVSSRGVVLTQPDPRAPRHSRMP